MNPKELRIGNLVKCDGRIFEIYCTDKEYPYLNTEEFGVGVVEWDDIEGVPMTEDILLKVGFVKHDRGYISGVHNTLFSGLMKLKFDHMLQSFVFSVGEYSDITRVQYLHQLQNLYFALTGEELNTEGIK